MARRPGLWLSALLLVAAGCMAPTQGDPAAAEPAAVAQAPAALPARAPPMSDPLPPLRAADRDAAGRPPRAEPSPAQLPADAPARIDTACTRDADCTIKDVGNCCGYYPACVNVDSPTDPAGVQAQCAREGRMAVCGFPSISACHCVAGECRGDGAAVDR